MLVHDALKCLGLALVCVGLGACANVGARMADAVNGAAVAVSGQSAQERVHAAMDALDRGDEARGKALLESALRQEPGNATAHRLLEEINREPGVLLGARMQTYTVRPGDTMTELAERFAGDPLMFYALARFNHMAPNQLAARQTIQVPARVHSAAAVNAGAAAQVAANTTSPSRAAVTPGSEASLRANQLRLQGLERLNAGDADGAVRLLQQARALDAGNGAIQNDLSRALRIQASLVAH